jgi:hypothetical protein
MKIPFLGGAYEGRSSNVSPETCINLFYEKGVNGEALVGTPGSTVLTSGSDTEVAPVRGGIAYNNKAYFVIGNSFYEIDPVTGGATNHGDLNTSSGRVSMAHNGVRPGANQQIMVVDGVDGWIFDNGATSWNSISDGDFTTAVTVAFIDGYFVYNEAGESGKFWLTDLYDGTSITATNFSNAEGWPDGILSLLADNRQLFMFGEESLEIWYNAGDVDNIFQRYQGGFKQHGCAAAFSPARFDNSVVWLSRNDRGDSQVVRLGNGYMPQIISTPEVDYQISTYDNVDDAFSYVYQDEGHEFYVLTFPEANVTWVYDASTQMWHRRAHNIDDIFPSRERYNCHVFVGGKHLMGDYQNGNIYQLDNTIGTFDGNRVERERTTINISNEDKRFRISSVQLDMEEGIGTEVLSTDPAVNDEDIFWLSYSKDGGHTYSPEEWRTAGDSGQWNTRLIWRSLGIARSWIFKIRTLTTTRPILKGLIAKVYGDMND